MLRQQRTAPSADVPHHRAQLLNGGMTLRAVALDLASSTLQQFPSSSSQMPLANCQPGASAGALC
jgi:hypothetical protein